MNTLGNFDFTPGQMFTFTGLFHRCISQSGTATCPWAVKHKGRPKAIAEQVARLFDCPAHPSKDLISCLRKQDAYKLYSADRAIKVSSHKHAEIIEAKE
jgi:carboxylesterase type B